MIEHDLKGLEPFRNAYFPFLYIIEDRKLIADVITWVSQAPYGLEVGFGDEPTRVFNIDSTLPWIVTEPNKMLFRFFKNDIRMYWEDIDMNAVYMSHPIIALKTYATMEMQNNAQAVVHRNLDYRSMRMVDFELLRPGQRVVFIVDMYHTEADEMLRYANFLREHGYDSRLLKLRTPNLPLLTSSHSYQPNAYVLDLTK